MREKLVLIDGHSILNRAFYGIPDLSNAEGLHTNAVYGFLNIMFKILEEEKPKSAVNLSDIGYEKVVKVPETVSSQLVMSFPENNAYSFRELMISITASACERSIRPFKKARFVNSPGSAGRAPYLITVSKIFLTTKTPP